MSLLGYAGLFEVGIRLNTYKGITASNNPKNHENIFRFIPGDTDGTLSVKKAEGTAYDSGYCTKGDNKGNGAIILWGSTQEKRLILRDHHRLRL